MSRRTHVLLLAAALAALSLPLAAGQASNADAFGDKPPAVPSEVFVAIEGDSPSRLDVTFEQTWEDEQAVSMRRSLDAYFGAGTGDLSDEEVAALEEAVERDLRNKEVDWLALEGEPFTIRDVDVTFRGAEGQVEMPRPISMTHRLTLEAPEATDERALLQFFSLWNGTVAFEAPEGWYVAAVDDLEGAEGGALAIDGEFQQSRAVRILLAQGEPPEAPPAGLGDEGDGAALEPGDEAQEATAGGAEVAVLILVITALVVGALLAWRATRR